MSQKMEPELTTAPAGGPGRERFDEAELSAFYDRSNSPHTRRADARVVRGSAIGSPQIECAIYQTS